MKKKKKDSKTIIMYEKQQHVYTIYPVQNTAHAAILDLQAGKYKIKIDERGNCTLILLGYYV